MGLYETRGLVGVRHSGMGGAGPSVRFEHGQEVVGCPGP
jgi:hypothetical protein